MSLRELHLYLDDSGSRDPDRAPQIERGRALRAEGSGELLVTPCAYEHFALIAAYGAPEAVETRPGAGAPVIPTCPAVERR